MNTYTLCDFCETELDLGREFAYQLDSLNFIDDEFQLDRIRERRAYCGEPLRLCKTCNESVKLNRDALRVQEELERRDHELAVKAAKIVTVLLTVLGAFLWLHVSHR